MGIFIFELQHVRNLIQDLRLLRDAEPDNKGIDATICWLKNQMIGKVKHVEPFMRNRKWIKDEIAYENESATDYHDCVTCNNPCRGIFCADCWHVVLSEMHGEKEHTGENCKTA